MRTSTFIVFSLIIHVLCVAAIGLTPTKILDLSDNAAVEVSLPNVASTTTEAPQPQPQLETVVPTKKVALAKPKTEIAKTPTAWSAKEVTENATETQATSEQAASEDLTPEVENIKEEQKGAQTEAAAVPDDATEAASQDANQTGTSQDEAATTHAGQTSQTAVSYTQLKQVPGNQPPAYPIKARQENRQGQVDLVYRVTREGKVEDVRVEKSSGHKDLDQEAITAVSKFKFVPEQEGWAYHPINFALKGQSTTIPGRLRTAGSEGTN